MTWIVDTCVLLDIHLADPAFGTRSADCLAHLLPQGLACAPFTYIELAPCFNGERSLLDQFLAEAGVAHQAVPGAVAGLTPAWDHSATQTAYAGWWRHHQRRRAARGSVPRRPVADLLIATCATRFAGLVTRNGPDFLSFFDRRHLRIVDPTLPETWP